MREGHIRTTQLLIDNGAIFDHADTKNQRPIYYAIQANKFEMVKFLIDKGADLSMEDKKGISPSAWAKKHNRQEVLNLLMQNGAPNPDLVRSKSNKNRPKKAPVPETPPEPKPVVNERKLPRRYMLTKIRDGGFYTPMSDQEFEEF